jgi:hypothetical protein
MKDTQAQPPAKTKKFSETLVFRCTDAERTAILQAAKKHKVSLSGLLRSLAQSAN